MPQVDTIVIGAGPGGYHAAALAAARGESVVLIEADELGGTCLNRGCIPTKCLCAAANLASDIRGASAFGLRAALEGIDYPALRQRNAGIIADLRADVAAVLAKVQVIKGTARVIGPTPAVAVGDEIFEAPRLIIATGSAPAPLRCPGAELAMDSNAFLAMDHIPGSVVIIGAGVIGLEFASILCGFGCEVTVLEYAPEVLAGSGVDPDVAKRLRMLLKRRGIDIVTGAEVTAISPEKSVTYKTRKGEKTVGAEAVVAAVGRRPVVPEGAAEAGLRLTARGAVEVDSHLRTSVPGVYAIGDVNGLCMLAHAASAQAECVINGREYSPAFTPAVVFTMPECASVGLPETEGTTCVTIPFGANGKSRADGHPDGILKIVADNPTGRLLGAHAVGAHAADLIAEAAVAIAAGMTAGQLAGVVHAHPSVSELLADACKTKSLFNNYC